MKCSSVHLVKLENSLDNVMPMGHFSDDGSIIAHFNVCMRDGF